ncbi:flagellar biogenesis protein FliO [Amycolatopsis bartoniae]|nr:flagellar biogenesis protein FliO [Amycolatopsis bartoniae]
MEILFTTLMVIMAIAVVWFTVYVIYRLYADQR